MYVDVIFMINFIMNSLILLLTAWAAGIRYKIGRILFSATIGSCYLLVTMLPGMGVLHHFLCKILISFLLIVVAFGFKSRDVICSLLGFFYVIAFILGGSVSGWLYLSQQHVYLGSCEVVLTHLSWMDLLWGSCTGIFFITIVLRRMVSRIHHQQDIYEVRLSYSERTVELKGLLDTGNGLYTVMDHKPVILVDQYAIEPILSQEVAAFLRQNASDVWLTKLDCCTDVTWTSRIQVIPYHTISSHDLLLAFRVDQVVVESTSDCFEVSDVMVAIYNGSLSMDGTYSVLLHSKIMNVLNKK